MEATQTIYGSPTDRDYGPCYRCGKPLVDCIPVLLQISRNGEIERKQLCEECFLAVFDSIKPLEATS